MIDLNAVDVFNQTLLHYSIQYGCVEATKILVDDSKLKANIADSNGQTPMHQVFSRFFDPLDGRVSYHFFISLIYREESELSTSSKWTGNYKLIYVLIFRLECGKYLLANGYESSKVNMLAEDESGATPYELLMRLYQHSKKVLRSPYVLTNTYTMNQFM